jgi:hypothetical protein
MRKANEAAIALGATMAMLGVLGACAGGSGAGAVLPSVTGSAGAPQGAAPPSASVSADVGPMALTAAAPAPAPSSSAPPPAPDSTALPPLPPPRPTTIALGDGELAAGDAAFERGDLSGAQKHYAAAPHGAAATVGLARVRLAKVDAAFDYAAAKGNAVVAAVAADLSRATKASPGFGPAYVELGRAKLLLGDAQAASTLSGRGRSCCRTSPRRTRSWGWGCLRRDTRPRLRASWRGPSRSIRAALQDTATSGPR